MKRGEQVIPVTTGGFIAISKLQGAGLFSLLLPSVLLYSVVFNWGGKGCLVVRVYCLFLTLCREQLPN